MRAEYADQGTLEGGTARVPVRNVFDRPFSELRAMMEASGQECWACGRKGLVHDGLTGLLPLEVYSSPWDDEPITIYVHDNENLKPYTWTPCREATTSPDVTDFHYFTCEGCYRDVIVRNPRNGWHNYSRIVNECEEWCLRCVEEVLKQEGIAGFEVELEGLFERGRLFGMFFSVGELEGEGWEPEPGFHDAHITTEEQAMDLAARGQALHQRRRRIIIAYESMAIGGLEGYVTLFSKEPREPVNLS